MLKKLRIRFVCINMLIVTVMLLGIFATVLQFTRSQLAQESLALMRSTVSADPFSAAQIHGEQTRRPYFVLQVSMFGRVAVTDSNGYFDLSDEDTILELLNESLNAEADTGRIRAYDLRWLRVRGLTGQTVIFMDCSSEQSALRALGRICAVIFGASFLVFFGVSVLFAQWSVRPVEKAWDEQRRFVADASHELKTPLTVIMTDAEMLQSPDYGEQERQKLSGSILTMAKQMRGLVEGMLELARLDGGQRTKHRETVDWSALAAELAMCFEPMFFEKGLAFESRIAEGLSVRGREEQLREVLDILLDNARKYAADGSGALLTLEKQGRHALLCVASGGEAIAEADLKKIFGRFVRLDEARSMDRSYGLGLSIARSIVAEHKGRIWAESGEGVNRFYVQLPLIN